jgi:hypothetical protein
VNVMNIYISGGRCQALFGRLTCNTAMGLSHVQGRA